MDFPGVEAVCKQLAAEQEKDGFPWGELCLEDGDGAPIRVLSPTHDQEGFKAYFDDYIDKVSLAAHREQRHSVRHARWQPAGFLPSLR